MLRGINIAASFLAAGLVLTGTSYADHNDRAFAEQHGYEHGYRDGFHHGLDDRDHHNKFEPKVKDDDEGYDKSMGDKGQYKNGYRSGFVAGYQDGFYNRPGRFSQIYGPFDQTQPSRSDADRDDSFAQRGWSGSHIASDIGYRDGLAAGEADYNHRHDAKPEDQKDYHNADHGYRSNYGDKSAYQQQYRNAFVEGYRDAYSGRR